jgi:outer membrane protein OmpA-like peptidoglycan-associated protein
MSRGEVRKAQAAGRRSLRLESKRHVELWIYSFADMYMILVFFFIALTAIYAAKTKDQERAPASQQWVDIPNVSRGIATAESLADIQFAEGKYRLSKVQIDRLNEILPLIKYNKLMILEVEGYADALPPKKELGVSSNLMLSSLRASAVGEWFIENGVDANRVRTYSFGDGYSWSGSKRVKSDRRVVIKMYAKK